MTRRVATELLGRELDIISLSKNRTHRLYGFVCLYHECARLFKLRLQFLRHRRDHRPTLLVTEDGQIRYIFPFACQDKNFLHQFRVHVENGKTAKVLGVSCLPFRNLNGVVLLRDMLLTGIFEAFPIRQGSCAARRVIRIFHKTDFLRPAALNCRN